VQVVELNEAIDRRPRRLLAVRQRRRKVARRIGRDLLAQRSLDVLAGVFQHRAVLVDQRLRVAERLLGAIDRGLEALEDLLALGLGRELGSRVRVELLDRQVDHVLTEHAEVCARRHAAAPGVQRRARIHDVHARRRET
jgi:hypothetical protein